MYKEPKEQAREMFNKIRYMDGENKNCTTCDCVVKPIVNYMIDEILRANPSGWFNNGFDWEKEFFTTPVNEGWVDAQKYWNVVRLIVAGW